MSFCEIDNCMLCSYFRPLRTLFFKGNPCILTSLINREIFTQCQKDIKTASICPFRFKNYHYINSIFLIMKVKMIYQEFLLYLLTLKFVHSSLHSPPLSLVPPSSSLPRLSLMSIISTGLLLTQPSVPVLQFSLQLMICLTVMMMKGFMPTCIERMEGKSLQIFNSYK